MQSVTSQQDGELDKEISVESKMNLELMPGTFLQEQKYLFGLADF